MSGFNIRSAYTKTRQKHTSKKQFFKNLVLYIIHLNSSMFAIFKLEKNIMKTFLRHPDKREFLRTI